MGNIGQSRKDLYFEQGRKADRPKVLIHVNRRLYRLEYHSYSDRHGRIDDKWDVRTLDGSMSIRFHSVFAAGITNTLYGRCEVYSDSSPAEEEFIAWLESLGGAAFYNPPRGRAASQRERMIPERNMRWKRFCRTVDCLAAIGNFLSWRQGIGESDAIPPGDDGLSGAAWVVEHGPIMSYASKYIVDPCDGGWVCQSCDPTLRDDATIHQRVSLWDA